MNKIILLVFILSLGFSVDAQLLIADDYLAVVGSPDDNDFDHEFPVKNDSNQELLMYWELILEPGFPEEWETFLCDKNLCYTKFVRNCPEANVNVFGANETFNPFVLHIKPKGVEGQGSLILRFYYPQSDSLSVDYSFDISAISNGVGEVKIENLVLYPNPTIDNFQVKGDDNVTSIGIYNVVGKLVKEFKHTKGQTHDVQDLNKGMYLVRLLDNTGRVVKTMKLSKRGI